MLVKTLREFDYTQRDSVEDILSVAMPSRRVGLICGTGENTFTNNPSSSHGATARVPMIVVTCDRTGVALVRAACAVGHTKRGAQRV